MHADVAPLVESGRIPSEVGERLSQLSPGSFCLHKTWGAGKVASWDIFGGKITIDFEKSKAQVMGLKLALQKTEILDPTDFRAQKVEKFEELCTAAKEDPVSVVIEVLKCFNGSMTLDQFDEQISGSLVETKAYKKWWESTKKALRESKKVVVPSKRTEPMFLRKEDQSPLEAMLDDFEQTRDLKAKAATLDEMKSEIEVLKEQPDLVQTLVEAVDEVCKKGFKLKLGQVLDLVGARDELLSGLEDFQLPDKALRLVDIITSGNTRDLSEQISGLSSTRQRQIYESFPQSFGDEWVQKLLNVFDHVGSRGVAEIARLFDKQEKTLDLITHLAKSISHQSLGPDALGWICRERKKGTESIFGSAVGSAVLAVLEHDFMEDGPRKSTRLQALIMDDRELVCDFIAEDDANSKKHFSRRLLESPVFPELDRKSLMARIIKAYPETSDLVSGEAVKRDETMVVSWDSLEARKKELEDIVKVRIPQNIKEISLAASYGDLRENFEFKAAKQTQAVLNRRKEELDRDLTRAQGTDFKGANTKSVSIGTKVTMSTPGGDMSYTILGAWDSEPDEKILSYLSEIGQLLLGKEVGDELELKDLETEQKMTCAIKEIVAFNP